MSIKRNLILAVLVLVLVGAYVLFANFGIKKTVNSGVSTTTQPTPTILMIQAGKYIQYADSLSAGTNVLFFYSNSCSSCQALNDDIRANLNNIPQKLTIYLVNFDQNATLKEKYKVSVAHTLVQVDKDGKEIKTWAGSQSLLDVLNNLI